MSILDIERQVQAVCQPITGERATGTVFLKSATGATVSVPRGRYLFPIVNGKVRHELAFKTAANPATASQTSPAGGPWAVPPAGAAVSIFSNIGGIRHNLPAGTKFVIDQPLKPELEINPQTQTGTAGGEDPIDEDLALFNFVSFEYFGAKKTLELFQSDIGGKFPAAIMHWVESEPADGLTTSAVSRPTHRGPRVASYSELFEILVISSRADSSAERRGQGVRVLDELTALMLDRVSVDGEGLSSPGGIHIRRRWHESAGSDGFYKAFQVYGLRISVQTTIEQRDTRTYEDLRRFKINAPREDTPTDLPLVVDNLVENQQD